MAFLEWTEGKYGTGVSVCDDQHKELFILVNELNDAVNGGSRQPIGQRLDALVDYVVMHFAAEEKMMEEKGYSGLDAHRSEHAALVSTCAALQQKFHAGEAEIEASTMGFIKDWLDHHIPVIDKRYGPVLAGR